MVDQIIRDQPLNRLPPLETGEDIAESDDSTSPLSPPRRGGSVDSEEGMGTECCIGEKMGRATRQLALLTWKNLIVLRRSIVWTIFEMVTPLLFFALLYFISNKIGDTVWHDSIRFKSLNLYGNSSDFDSDGCPMQCVNYGKKTFGLLYSSDDTVPTAEIDRLLKGVEGRFSEGKINVEVRRMDNRRIMEKELRGDKMDRPCAQKYFGGVHFSRMDIPSRAVSYQLWTPYATDFRFSDEFSQNDSPFAFPDVSGSGQPFSIKPYCSAGVMSIQMAVDAEFAKMSGGLDEQEGLTTRALPRPKYPTTSMDMFLRFAHFLFALMTISIVLHTAREVASEEESGMKDFLMVMGMGRGVFYLSHVLIAFGKAALAITINCIPFFMILPLISPTLLLFTILLYSLAVICLAALVAAVFRTSAGAIKAAVIVTLVLPIVCAYSPRRENVTACVLASLNPNQALSYAFSAIIEAVQRDTPLTWSLIFAESSYVFTVGMSIVMLVVDIVLLLLGTVVIDWFISSSDSPLTLLTNTFYKSPLSQSVFAHRALSGAEETDSALVNADIVIENVIKSFGSSRAVDEMSMKAFKGQVTVLLGHNGAGKSTTFNMISGLTPPTSGSIKICGMDLREHLSSCQEKIGYCPQGNPLFNLLTVDEHFEFFARLKRIEGVQWRKDREDLIKSLKLDDKRGERSMNLSGGMKRKLCVGMALIARSEVILLDEPTAGMDAAARRDIEKILERYKRDSTILMTTHYTDEAEQLGDRMVIMARGRAVCSGSGAFLKKTFCTGYVLTVVMNENSADVERGVTSLVQRHVKGSTVTGVHGLQIDISMPKEEYERFPDLFAELEQNVGKLGVTSFGLSLNTLEQVFLRVGELADPQESIDGSDVMRRVKEVIENSVSREGTVARWWSALQALLWKRWLYLKAHWTVLISQFLIPILLLLAVANLLELLSNVNTGQDRPISLEALPSSRFLIFDQGMPTGERQEYLRRIGSMRNVRPLDIPAGGTAPDDWAVQQQLQRPPFSAGVSIEGNRTTVHHSEVFLHSLPAAISLADGVRYGAEIKASMHLYSPTIGDDSKTGGGAGEEVSNQMVKSAMTGPVFVFIFSLLTSPFITFPIVDRASKFMHQQLLTGISPLLFWLSSFIFDGGLYLIGCLSYLAVFLITDWLTGYHAILFLLFLCYFLASIFAIYTFAFVFASPAKGHIVLVIYQVLITLVAFLLTLLVSYGLIPASGWHKVAEGVIMILVPSFALCRGGYIIAQAKSPLSAMAEQAGLEGAAGSLWAWGQLGHVFTYLLVTAAVSLCVFILIQERRIWKTASCAWNSMHSAVVGVEEREGVHSDEGVAAEREEMAAGARREGLPLAIDRLTKRYGRFKAIDSISFGVRARECFGLLGVNGAGKSTTFSIMTGEALPTEGSCHIYGKSVVDESVRMGYCPQVDALLPELTGRQVLMILASLHGYTDAARKCTAILRAVGMEEHADKETGKYSGGQRRKLSTGVSILAQNRLVVLDEPTAGIDPKARREIWSVINGIRETGDTAVLLTSHSMDECEALCSRIGVLARGKMVALGTSQMLKSKYGNSYTLTLVMGEGGLTRGEVEAEVRRTFPKVQMRESHSSTLEFEMERSRDSLWSETFRRAIDLSKKVGAKDFCVTQSSLQQTFLQIAKE